MIITEGGVLNEANTNKNKNGKKYDIFVIRIGCSNNTCKLDNNIQLVNSRPCYHCLNMMKVIGIRRVYYTNDIGEIIYENVKDMFSIHISNISRRYDLLKLSSTCYNNHLDYLIKTQIPNTMKEISYRNFINYNFKSISNKYNILEENIKKNNSYSIKISILDLNNNIIKIIILL
jgi:hypothetical protein